ncbi:hypothetical protein L2E82_37689 [Cichorium intybus]|uniref:Uncharacterized protein n=1 Tax=Cichorium intybus TaxID=13427 RepID=A0ACB9AFK0_CICIN|nr:hypothetical protein L2E82_37689 [Cichorium intybus]
MAQDDPKQLPNKRLASKNDELEDTACNKPKREVIEMVEMTNIEIMKGIQAYRQRNGVCPTMCPYAFQQFCCPYIRMGVGNEGGWLKKMEEVKTTFNSESAPRKDVDKKEFKLWKKISGE